MGAMLRLRRLVVSDRWFFVTCRLLPRRRIFSDADFDCWAQVIHERRESRAAEEAKLRLPLRYPLFDNVTLVDDGQWIEV